MRMTNATRVLAAAASASLCTRLMKVSEIFKKKKKKYAKIKMEKKK